MPTAHTNLPSTRDLDKAKFAFTTRRVDRSAIAGLISGSAKPSAGDLVLARVVKLGQHTGLQSPDGRRATMFPGDSIVVVCGDRYAPNQFEAEVPKKLGPAHLVAGGGIAARVLNKNRKVKPPTSIHIEGILADSDGKAINLIDWALQRNAANWIATVDFVSAQDRSLTPIRPGSLTRVRSMMHQV
jgi:hypothetical protein